MNPGSGIGKTASVVGETQPARTALAWQRTGLGLLVVGGLLGRGAAQHRQLALLVPTTIVACAALLILGVLTPHRQRTSQEAAHADGDGRAPRAAALTTAFVVLAGLCALAGDLLTVT